MKAQADLGDIDKAVTDALICGTGVIKFWLDNGKITMDHVPISQFADFAAELVWRKENTIKELTQ